MDQKAWGFTPHRSLEPYVNDRRIGIFYDQLTGSVIALPARWFIDAIEYLEALVTALTLTELNERVPKTYSHIIREWLDRLEEVDIVDLDDPIPGSAYASFSETVENLPPTPNMLRLGRRCPGRSGSSSWSRTRWWRGLPPGTACRR